MVLSLLYLVLSSISNINFSLFKTLKEEGITKAWTQLNGNFLASLFIGMLISLLSLAKVISWLLDTQPILLWSFFFGLVLASIIYIAKQITHWSITTTALLIGASILAYYITTLNPLISENTSLFFIFLAGVIAICAMILPGISGSFILVLLGAYKSVLDAVNNRDLITVSVFMLGCITGLLIFSKVLKWLFANYKNLTLATLTGFIIGSLNKIWPWKKVLTFRTNSHNEQVPFNEASISPYSYDGNPQLLFAIIFAIIGFSLILLLEKIAVNNKN